MNARTVVAALFAFASLSLFAQPATFEGVVRSVDPDEHRVVILTGGGEIVAAVGSDATPVLYSGSTYRIRNLEVGDRIRMTAEGDGDNRRVASIEVLESVPRTEQAPERPPVAPARAPETTSAPSRVDVTTLTSVVGKVDQTRPDRNLIRIIADGGLSWVRIDAANAQTPEGAPFKVSDLKFGETIEAIGKVGSNGEIVATVIRRGSEVYDGIPAPAILVDEEPELEDDDEPASVYVPREIKWLDVVEFRGQVVAALDGTQTMTIRNEVTGADDVVWCDQSLLAIHDGDPTEASEIESGMTVEVRALRVSEGLVAQVIRIED